MKVLVLVMMIFLISCTKKDPLRSHELTFAESITKQVFKRYPVEGASENQWDFVNDHESSFLNITRQDDTESEAAKQRMVQKQNQLKLLTEPIKAPYSGKLTKEISCASRNRLDGIIQESEKAILLTLGAYASEKFVFGLCEESQEKWKTQYLFLYCKNTRTLYEIKYFYNKSHEWELKPLAECP